MRTSTADSAHYRYISLQQCVAVVRISHVDSSLSHPLSLSFSHKQLSEMMRQQQTKAIRLAAVMHLRMKQIVSYRFYHENDCVVQRIVVIGSILVLWTTDTTLDYSNTVPFYRLYITYMLYLNLTCSVVVLLLFV